MQKAKGYGQFFEHLETVEKNTSMSDGYGYKEKDTDNSNPNLAVQNRGSNKPVSGEAAGSSRPGGKESVDYKAEGSPSTYYSGEKAGTGRRNPTGNQGSNAPVSAGFTTSARAGKNEVQREQFDGGQSTLKSNPHADGEQTRKVTEDFSWIKVGKSLSLLDMNVTEDQEVANGIEKGIWGVRPTRNLKMEQDYNQFIKGGCDDETFSEDMTEDTSEKDAKMKKTGAKLGY